jgi:hypothetical protein
VPTLYVSKVQYGTQISYFVVWVNNVHSMSVHFATALLVQEAKYREIKR